MGLKRLTESCLARDKEHELKSACLHGNREHQMVLMTPHASHHAPQLSSFQSSPTPIIFVCHKQSVSYGSGRLTDTCHSTSLFLPVSFIASLHVEAKRYTYSVTSTTLTNAMSCLATRRRYGGQIYGTVSGQDRKQ